MPTPLGSRPMTALGGLALTLALSTVLAGCGEEEGPVTGSPPLASSTPPTPDPSSEDPATPEDWQLVELVSETNAGGSMSTEVTVVDNASDLSTYVDQFSSDPFAQEVTDAVESHTPREGYVAAAAVVAVGCDAPTAVTYVDGVIRAVKVPKPLPNCFAPVTTVAVLEIPQL